jgi:hypothetical protein
MGASSGRLQYASIRSTRATVGATIGRPSVQPRA